MQIGGTEVGLQRSHLCCHKQLMPGLAPAAEKCLQETCTSPTMPLVRGHRPTHRAALDGTGERNAGAFATSGGE